MRLIPHVSAITKGLRSVLRPGENVDHFSLLKELYFSLWDFDEDFYLSHHEDLQNAIPNRDFLTGREHFEAVGYFEGRLPLSPDIDNDWYLSAYPDVSSAIIEGALQSAREHFLLSGYAEGRLPSDPEVDAKWYAPRFLQGSARLNASAKDCTEHYLQFGYRNGAFPAPPK